MFGEVDFDIVSTDTLDLALKEAEVIKVLDEIVTTFPSLSSTQMCFHLGHSQLLQLDPDAPPALPPKPEKRTGIERIKEMHAIRVATGEGEANEVIVEGDGSFEEYGRYVEGMLI